MVLKHARIFVRGQYLFHNLFPSSGELTVILFKKELTSLQTAKSETSSLHRTVALRVLW